MKINDDLTRRSSAGTWTLCCYNYGVSRECSASEISLKHREASFKTNTGHQTIYKHFQRSNYYKYLCTSKVYQHFWLSNRSKHQWASNERKPVSKSNRHIQRWRSFCLCFTYSAALEKEKRGQLTGTSPFAVCAQWKLALIYFSLGQRGRHCHCHYLRTPFNAFFYCISSLTLAAGTAKNTNQPSSSTLRPQPLHTPVQERSTRGTGTRRLLITRIFSDGGLWGLEGLWLTPPHGKVLNVTLVTHFHSHKVSQRLIADYPFHLPVMIYTCSFYFANSIKCTICQIRSLPAHLARVFWRWVHEDVRLFRLLLQSFSWNVFILNVPYLWRPMKSNIGQTGAMKTFLTDLLLLNSNTTVAREAIVGYAVDNIVES